MTTRTAQTILQEEFLIARAKMIELAAILDRIDRAAESSDRASVDSHPAMKLLGQGIEILNDNQPNRARRIQELMSRPYDPNWRVQMSIP